MTTLAMISVSAGYGTDGSSTPTMVARAGAEADGLADHGGIALERRRPETIGEHDGAGGVRAVVAHVEQTAEHGMQAHHLEIGAADHAGANLARLAEADHGEADRREVAELRSAFDAGLQVLDFGHGEVRVLDAEAGRALANVDQAVSRRD